MSSGQSGAVRQELAQANGTKLVVTHVKGKLQFPVTETNLSVALGKHLRPILTVRGNHGVPVYEVYTYR